MTLQITDEHLVLVLYIIGGILGFLVLVISGILAYLVHEQEKVRRNSHNNKREIIEVSGRTTVLELDRLNFTESVDRRLDAIEFMVRQLSREFEKNPLPNYQQASIESIKK